MKERVKRILGQAENQDKAVSMLLDLFQSQRQSLIEEIRSGVDKIVTENYGDNYIHSTINEILDLLDKLEEKK